MKKIFVLALTLAFGLITAGYSYASYGSVSCQPIYGGGTTCETSSKFVLDKKVLNPAASKGGTEQYVDNLSINDSRFTPSQVINFELTVTNTGNTVLTDLILSDVLPSQVIFVSGPGSYDQNSNTLTYKVVNLNPNESRKFIIQAKIKDANSLPNSQGIICVVNQASVSLNDDESKDNSQFCIEKTVVTNPVMPAPVITQTPSTGAESLALIGLIPAAVGGLFLRKFKVKK